MSDQLSVPGFLLLRSALVVAGVGAGFWHAMRPGPDGEPGDLRDRLSRLEDWRAASMAAVPTEKAGTVTPLELAEAMDRVAARLQGEMDARFDAQDRAIVSLRELTEHTGRLIGELLDKMQTSDDIGEYAASGSLNT